MLSSTLVVVICSAIFFGIIQEANAFDKREEAKALEFLERFDKEKLRLVNLDVLALWNYETNITDHNLKARQETSRQVQFNF